MINRFLHSWRAFRVTWNNNCKGMDDIDYWDQPNGSCSQCGAPLNEYLCGGYRLHNGEYSVAASSYEKQIK